MDCLRSVWQAGKSCCGPKTFYALVAGSVGLVLLAGMLAIVVPLHLRGDASWVLVDSTPVSPAGKVQVQGDSHSLVHIQEGIDTGGHSGRQGVRGPIRHLGLVVAVRICSILLIVALVHQVWRFVTFHSRTAKVPPREPLEEAQRQRVMEAQYREFMERQLAEYVSRKQGVPGSHWGRRSCRGGL